MTDAGGHPVFTPKINPEDHSAKVVLCGALTLTPVTLMAALGIYNRVRSKTLSQVDSFITLLGIVCYASAQPHDTHIRLTVRLSDSGCRNICDVSSRHLSRLWETHDSSDGCTT